MIKIDFTEYDLREMLSALDSMPVDQNKVQVFESNIGGIDVLITVSN